jgi:LuxR family maltose regulon positive regulatory protein
VFEIRMLRALTHDAQGLRPRAVDDLARALAEVPEPEGYQRLLLDEGRWMTALLRDVTQPAGRSRSGASTARHSHIDRGTREAARSA